eukprot:scaffold12646_cov115-Isochrysis_galbana.AAC.10
MSSSHHDPACTRGAQAEQPPGTHGGVYVRSFPVAHHTVLNVNPTLHRRNVPSLSPPCLRMIRRLRSSDAGLCPAWRRTDTVGDADHVRAE